jgi:hypothetical protein
MDQNVAEIRPRRRLQKLPHFLRDNPHWSHSSTYRRAKDHPGLLLKLDRATIVDLDVVDRIEAELPTTADHIGSPDARP